MQEGARKESALFPTPLRASFKFLARVAGQRSSSPQPSTPNKRPDPFAISSRIIYGQPRNVGRRYHDPRPQSNWPVALQRCVSSAEADGGGAASPVFGGGVICFCLYLFSYATARQPTRDRLLPATLHWPPRLTGCTFLHFFSVAPIHSPHASLTHARAARQNRTPTVYAQASTPLTLRAS